MDHCIVYLGRLDPGVEQAELITILERSQLTNRQWGVTGVTLYVRGNVIQVLEGKKPVVESLYARIAQDERHTNLEKVLDRPISERLFGDYVMGYETLTDEQLEAIKALVDLETPLGAAPSNDRPGILKTIKAFYQGNHYN